MLKILFLSLVLALTLFAQNPRVYSALGDVLYDSLDNIEKLQLIDEYKVYRQKIDRYAKRVRAAKKVGFAIENGDETVTPKGYLRTLRELAKEHDFFTREVEASFHEAIRTKNSKLFHAIINSGLLDTDRYKKEIIGYYFEHSDELQTQGLIQKYLDEDAKLRAKKEAQKKHYKTKKQREKERIERLRRRDKLEQERLEKELQEKLLKKKQEIREYQEKELSKTI
jgi:hypothetical protein